jgi:hypothetical protein
MSKLFSKDFEVQISAAGQSVKKIFELDKSMKTVTHYTILSNREDLLYYRGSFGLEINKDEIVAEGYSVKKVVCWPSVPADSRLKSIGKLEVGSGLINFQYSDTADGLTTFQPYTVTLSVEGERHEL